MSEYLWVRGTHPAAITPRGVVLMAPGNMEMAHQFWRLLHEGGDLSSILQELTTIYASDLASLPEFVALLPDGDSLHVAIRGGYELVVRTREGTQSVTSGSVIMWMEHRFTGVLGWRMSGVVSGDLLATQPELWSAIDAVVPVSVLESGDNYSNIVPAESQGDVVESEEPAAAALPSADHDGREPAGESGATISEPDVTLSEIGATASEPGATISETGIYGMLSAVDLEAVAPEPESKQAPEPDDTGATVSDELLLPGELAESDSDESTPEEPVEVTDLEPQIVETDGGQAANGPDFSALWAEHTIHRDVERAAVRDVRNDDDPFRFALPSEPLSVPAAPSADEPVLASVPDDHERIVLEMPSRPEKPDSRDRQDSPGSSRDFFVDGAPRVVSDLPLPPAPADSDAAGAGPEGDHDGHTVRSSQIDGLLAKARELAASEGAESADPGAPRVLALLCVGGHPNPTHAQSCRECGAEMSETSMSIPQPKLGTLVTSDGTAEALYGDIIIGRQPKIHPAMGDTQRALTVLSPKKEISRSHCEVRVTGWDVRLRDLGSNNGTFLIRPGQGPLRVSESSPVIVKIGDVIDLGEGVTIRMES